KTIVTEKLERIRLVLLKRKRCNSIPRLSSGTNEYLKDDNNLKQTGLAIFPFHMGIARPVMI
ncbi:hypothetical protein, partial [Bilophila wadsworthia]|uniref:hypothetical protein n=1 Tax=Bilophila wadsworthia TaxID=35833 RepID=UPI003A88E412